MTQADITLYHAPRSRSLTVYFMLEELGVPYNLHLLNLRKAEQKTADYLAINPMGKVPCLRVGTETIFEAPAICLYLAEKFSDKGFNVSIDSGMRGDFLKWMFFTTACFEPAVIDYIFKRDNPDPASISYGTLPIAIRAIEQALNDKEWVLGDQFTAADVVLGSSVFWAKMTGSIKEGSVLDHYAQRIAARDAHKRTSLADNEFYEKQQAELEQELTK